MKTVFLFLGLLLAFSAFSQSADSTSISKEEKREQWVSKHKPRLATILSAVVPGAGQIYNRKYWKAPVVWAGIGVTAYYADYNNVRFKMYRDGYLALIDDDPTTVDPWNGEFSESFIKENMDFHRHYRDLSYVGMILVYSLNIIDANVDAHFLRFDVSDDLTMHFYPSIGSPLAQTPSLSVAFTLR